MKMVILITSSLQHLIVCGIAKYTNVHAIVTIGAAFDFHTNRVRKAPGMDPEDGYGMVFRFTQEPKRLFKSYATVVPKFIFYNLIDKRISRLDYPLRRMS